MRNINEEAKKIIPEYQRTGNEETLKEIIKLVEPIVKTAIRKIHYTEPITYAELKQECDIRVWEIAKKYEWKEGTKTNFTNYLTTDLVYYLINYLQVNQTTIRIPYAEYRKAAKEDSTEELTKMLNKEDISEMADYKGKCDKYFFDEEFDDERLINIFDNLTEEEKDILKMQIIDECTFLEIAKKYGCSRETMRQRYKKILEKCKDFTTF